MKYYYKKNKNISLVVILIFLLMSCILVLLNVDLFSVDLLVAIFMFISISIIIYKLINNLGCYVLILDDAVYIKINKEELTIKFVQIYRIEIETIVKDLYINIYYGDDYQIRIDYLKRLYLDLKNKLQI